MNKPNDGDDGNNSNNQTTSDNGRSYTESARYNAHYTKQSTTKRGSAMALSG
jgi:hypothetical protein